MPRALGDSRLERLQLDRAAARATRLLEVLQTLARGDAGAALPRERERVFERFARGSEARTAGSGLGLALVRQQARLHGGEVTVSDGQLGGACFTVRLSAGGDGPPAEDRTTG